MFHSISTEVQAFYLSRILYRDTKLEVYHRKLAVLGKEIYDDMIRVVAQNAKKIQRFHPKMIEIQTEEEADAQLRNMSVSERKEFIEYVYTFDFLSKCACNWDPPQKLELTSIPKNIPAFLLGGRFTECCREHRALTDTIMCYINQDIYNRVYTLLCDHIFP